MFDRGHRDRIPGCAMQNSTTLALPMAVDVPPKANGDDENEEDVVVHLVDDPVVPGANSPLTVAASQCLGPAGPWRVREQFDSGLNAALGGSIKFA